MNEGYLALKILKGDFTGVTLRDDESHADVFTEAYKMATVAIERLMLVKPKMIYNFPVCPVCESAVQRPFPCRCGQMIDYRKDNNEDT